MREHSQREPFRKLRCSQCYIRVCNVYTCIWPYAILSFDIKRIQAEIWARPPLPMLKLPIRVSAFHCSNQEQMRNTIQPKIDWLLTYSNRLATPLCANTLKAWLPNEIIKIISIGSGGAFKLLLTSWATFHLRRIVVQPPNWINFPTASFTLRDSSLSPTRSRSSDSSFHASETSMFSVNTSVTQLIGEPFGITRQLAWVGASRSISVLQKWT